MRISDWSSDVCSSDLNADGITVHDGDTEIGTVEDVLLGTANDDSYGVDGYANGGAGDDDLFGGGSRDWLVGGTGDDDLYGGGAVDHLEGGAGDDTLSGGTGIDVLGGGGGSDTSQFDTGAFGEAEHIKIGRADWWERGWQDG